MKLEIIFKYIFFTVLIITAVIIMVNEFNKMKGRCLLGVERIENILKSGEIIEYETD